MGALSRFASQRLRGLVIDANDGIVATAGVVEGLAGAGATTRSTLVAALGAMIAGGLALGSSRYAEVAAEIDIDLALVEEERRQLAMSPDQEQAELAAQYEMRGLSPELARQVAEELSQKNALAAHAEVEHGIVLGEATGRPLTEAALSGLAFALGATVTMLTVLVTPRAVLGMTTLIAVVISLTLTSIIHARWGNVSVLRTVARNVGVGVLAMVIAFAIGSLFDV